MAVSPETVAHLLGAERGLVSRSLAAAARTVRAIGRTPLGAFGLVTIALVVLMAVFGSLIAPQDPLATGSFDFAHRLEGPSGSHWFGTDEAGRDLLSQFLLGARVSLVVGLVAGLASAAFGTVTGICAGYAGGWAERGLTLVGDWFLVLPFVPFALFTAALLQDDAGQVPGGRTGVIALVLAIAGWAGTARLVRASTRALRDLPFVERARAQGATHAAVLRRHILPNVMPAVWANALLVVAFAVLGEAGLSFFGLGAADSFSWGTMLSSGSRRERSTTARGGTCCRPAPPSPSSCSRSSRSALRSRGCQRPRAERER